ncbi:MAG: hypothetical protein CMJ67_06030 [Planctomycetaceae bacterium]|nr:hypothetical protein [Planctomycetaceae bacterium]
MSHRVAPDLRFRGRLLLTALLPGTLLLGCETVTTEYHTRPGFYKLASEQELKDEFIDAEGRRVVFIEDGRLPSEQEAMDAEKRAQEEAARRERKRLREKAIAAGRPIPPEAMEPEPPKEFKSREVLDDGTVRLYAILPEHVIANVMSCLRKQEYFELWEQVVANSTRQIYTSRGEGVEEFVQWCVRNRSELMMSLNRMSFGYYGGSDVIIDRLPDLSVRVRFSPTIASQFDFKEVLVVQERDGMKLAGIR